MDSGNTTSHVSRTAVLSDRSFLVNFAIGATTLSTSSSSSNVDFFDHKGNQPRLQYHSVDDDANPFLGWSFAKVSAPSGWPLAGSSTNRFPS